MTKAEKAWLDAITELGCIVCRIRYALYTPAVPHHLLSGGRRIGHLATIPLCDPGHHQNPPPGWIARHPTKARFEKAYGTEAFLLRKTKELVKS
jgi:hypothetical protein